MLDYKCCDVIKVKAAYTSQQHYECEYTEADNRMTQRQFECMARGHADRADLNAAANILASGIGHLHSEGCSGYQPL